MEIQRVSINKDSLFCGYLIENVLTIPYTADDIKYQNYDCKARKEYDDRWILPEIKCEINYFNECSLIFIGYPIWFGQAPSIIITFLKKYDFNNKNIITFSTFSSFSDSSSSLFTLHTPN